MMYVTSDPAVHQMPGHLVEMLPPSVPHFPVSPPNYSAAPSPALMYSNILMSVMLPLHCHAMQSAPFSTRLL